MEHGSAFEVTPPTPTHTCAGMCNPVSLLEGVARHELAYLCASIYAGNSHFPAPPYNTKGRLHWHWTGTERRSTPTQRGHVSPDHTCYCGLDW